MWLKWQTFSSKSGTQKLSSPGLTVTQGESFSVVLRAHRVFRMTISHPFLPEMVHRYDILVVKVRVSNHAQTDSMKFWYHEVFHGTTDTSTSPVDPPVSLRRSLTLSTRSAVSRSSVLGTRRLVYLDLGRLLDLPLTCSDLIGCGT